ncbi:2-iminoacetate synthase ThiH [Aliarcobacter skirrowii]|uniref:2-iminoacetate synthase ThiH n=1 Tax=Aliarcobacter skirrowii TaxID=28200 RepID=A0A2U2C3U1_9BACT|nr:2-iminoacetate synthase ThiH [Aliarcobacter skirrowii]MDX4036010.1 2-iminoacetate synthase ThiH [Aliarcobacter skirrowii]PWE23668.1 2-iminoacetate synthase ThiH [Aliarcobacter skirrowii]
MEDIESDIESIITSSIQNFNYSKYSSDDVKRALKKDRLDLEDFKALLSPNAEEFLEIMAQRAKEETKKNFGNSILLFTPLYIANYCENECTYCGFKATNKIKRASLTTQELENELQSIAKTGLKEILLLTGEARRKSSVSYIASAVKLARKYFSTVALEVYPVNLDEYKLLHESGADFVAVYQETYNRKKYEDVHLWGSKRNFSYRINAQERALKAGFRGVAFGALLGLDDFRKDAFAAALHATLIQQRYPHAEISFSVPRLRPYINNKNNNSNDVYEKQLLQVMCAYRIFMPYATITISTRERDVFRDNVVGLVANKISAGVSVGVGGHDEEKKGDEQFEISDERSVEDVHTMILNKSLQPVYSNFIRV